jgi:hypothetical protein
MRRHIGPGRARERAAQFRESAAFDRDHFDDGDVQRGGERGRIHGDAACEGLVDHVEGEHHRLAERGELGGEHQRAAHVARVGDLDDHVRLLAGDDVARDPLVLA